VKSDERAPPAPPEVGAQSVGQYLASQRRLRRISLEELSERTRIPRRNLERLESGALDADADGFTRGFVRTVAEALGLDAQEAVMRLVGEPHADERRALAAARSAALWRLAALVLGVCLLIGGGLYFALRAERSEKPASAQPAVTYRRDAVRSLAEHEREASPPPAPQEP
jgi:cytoskeletal protein RodZ